MAALGNMKDTCHQTARAYGEELLRSGLVLSDLCAELLEALPDEAAAAEASGARISARD
jgi:hypothetical protein